MKQRRISPAERDHVWMGAMKKDLLLISYIISTAQVTSRGGIVSPGHKVTLYYSYRVRNKASKGYPLTFKLT